MCEERIDLTLDSSPLAQYLASIGLQDELPKAELHLEDLPPIKSADQLTSPTVLPDPLPPWTIENDVLAELQPIVLNCGLIPSDEVSLLQLRSLAIHSPAVPLWSNNGVALRWLIFPAAFILWYLGLMIVAALALVVAFLAIRARRPPLEKQPLIARFDSLCETEVKRHELLFLFIRRIEELEQLERGYRFTTSAPTLAAQIPSPSRYLALLQRTAKIALKSCAVHLQQASSFLAGALGPKWQHLLPAIQFPAIEQADASAYVLRQVARDVCALRTAWIYHLLALAATKPTVLLQHWNSVAMATRSIDEMRGVLDVETYLAARVHGAPKAQPKSALARELSLLRQQLRSTVALAAAAEESSLSLQTLSPRIIRLNEELAYAGALLVQIQTYLSPQPAKAASAPPSELSAAPRSDTEVFEASGVAERKEEDAGEEERDEERIARMTIVAREMAALLTGKPSVYPPLPLDTIRAKSTRITLPVVVASKPAASEDSDPAVATPAAPPPHLFAELRNVLIQRKATSTQVEEQFGSD